MQLVEETVFTEEIRCDHSYDKRCHTSYITAFQSQQEEECEENFRKTCFIQYEQVDKGGGGGETESLINCLLFSWLSKRRLRSVEKAWSRIAT